MIVVTICSGCMEDVTIDVEGGIVTHERAGLQAETYGDGDLIQWDCPVCEYADSFDMTQHEEDE